MNHTPDQNEPAARITLDELRALIESDEPVGAEVALTCRYDVRTLAQKCGCSLRHLERVFSAFHRTPHSWLRERRLLHELQELAGAQLTGQLESVKRVALELGYHYPNHFIRAFKAVYQTTPRRFLAEREKALKQVGIVPEARSTSP